MGHARKDNCKSCNRKTKDFDRDNNNDSNTLQSKRELVYSQSNPPQYQIENGPTVFSSIYDQNSPIGNSRLQINPSGTGDGSSEIDEETRFFLSRNLQQPQNLINPVPSTRPPEPEVNFQQQFQQEIADKGLHEQQLLSLGVPQLRNSGPNANAAYFSRPNQRSTSSYSSERTFPNRNLEIISTEAPLLSGRFSTTLRPPISYYPSSITSTPTVRHTTSKLMSNILNTSSRGNNYSKYQKNNNFLHSTNKINENLDYIKTSTIRSPYVESTTPLLNSANGIDSQSQNFNGFQNFNSIYNTRTRNSESDSKSGGDFEFESPEIRYLKYFSNVPNNQNFESSTQKFQNFELATPQAYIPSTTQFYDDFPNFNNTFSLKNLGDNQLNNNNNFEKFKNYEMQNNFQNFNNNFSGFDFGLYDAATYLPKFQSDIKKPLNYFDLISQNNNNLTTGDQNFDNFFEKNKSSKDDDNNLELKSSMVYRTPLGKRATDSNNEIQNQPTPILSEGGKTVLRILGTLIQLSTRRRKRRPTPIANLINFVRN